MPLPALEHLYRRAGAACVFVATARTESAPMTTFPCPFAHGGQPALARGDLGMVPP